MAGYLWMIAFIVLLGFEAATMALTTIWFAGGSLAAFIAAGIGVGIKGQLLVFVVVSFVLLFFTRPFAKKYLNRNTEKTNADGLVGKRARITQTVNNMEGTGAAVINGQEWTARATKEGAIYEAGVMVEVKDISGVKLMVEEIREEK